MNIHIVYSKNLNIISFIHGKLIISAILKGYDSIEKITKFDAGYIEVLMRKGNSLVEEFIDFNYALSLIGLKNKSGDYFNNVSINNIKLMNMKGYKL